MADQKYESKSYILSFKVKDKDSVNGRKNDYIIYSYKVEIPVAIDKETERVVYLEGFNNSLHASLLKKGDGRFFENNTNQLGEESGFSDSVEHEFEAFKIRLVIHSHKDFSLGQASYANDVASFAQDFFPTPKNNEETNYIPIIHLTLDDCYVDNLYADVNKDIPSRLSRSYQILDSSIWNKIVPYNNIKREDFEVGGVAGLYKAIREIDSNYHRGLYYFEVAHEYANLNARLAKQAFLSGSHASGVSPFIFHSESAIEFLINRELCLPCSKEEASEYKKKSISDKIAEHKWRLLLVDDKASGGLTSKEKVIVKRTDSLLWNSKLAVIIDLLKSHFSSISNFYVSYRDLNNNETSDNEKNGIIIEYAETVDAAEKLLREKKFDLILLDYLLDKGGSTEYGYKLLNLIYREIDEKRKLDKDGKVPYEKISYKIGPHRRFFFIFISAYTTAVYERLLAEGLNRSEEFWHIAVGACPTNTPNLFLYNLLKLMEKQLVDSGVDKLSAKNIYEIVNNIFSDKEVRSKANDTYQDVLDMHYYYKKMLKDVSFPSDGDIFNTKGSVLISDFIKRNVNLGGLLEHLTQLIHLTAFGTIRQWPEMWEEYIYFKAQFDLQQFKNCFNDENNATGKFNQLCEHIELYILKLKSDME